MNNNRIQIIAFALVALLFLIYSAAYTVDQRQTAIKFKFREIVRTNIPPGLHFRVPVIETVSKFPSQILTLSSRSERFLTGEKKYVVVDFYVKWRIEDTARFYNATGGGRMIDASSRLEDIMKDGLRNEFSRRTIEQVLSEDRDEIMSGLESRSRDAARELGIAVVDVRVNKIDFPEQVSESVFNRMSSERMRVAQDFRSRGQEEAEKIRAAADRTSTILMAEAYRDAEKIRGEGDALAANIYSNAYGQDSEFFAFYRSLEVYRNSLAHNTTLVLEPSSDFFRYFKSPNGRSNEVKAVQAKKSATTASSTPSNPVNTVPTLPMGMSADSNN